jgi:hypothetical protein
VTGGSPSAARRVNAAPTPSLLAMLRERWPDWVGYAAAAWSLAYALLGGYWAAGGGGFPFGVEHDPESSILEHASPDTTAPVIATLAAAATAVWTLAEDRSVYVVEHAGGAGNSVVTIFVDDLETHVAAVAARGLEPHERVTYSNGVRKALYRDPDGNELGFGGAPLDSAS